MAPGRSTLADLEDGEFKRQASSFRNWISSDQGAQFPAVAGRYHLYISYACPWAWRCYGILKLKGLEHAIGITAFKEVFETLDKAEVILDKQRYLVGNQLTEADIWFFVTLIRFDEVYFVHFKTNKRLIREYHNILNYTKEIYQTDGIADTVNMWHIKHAYYCSLPTVDPSRIVPVGYNYDYSSKHDRDRFK